MYILFSCDSLEDHFDLGNCLVYKLIFEFKWTQTGLLSPQCKVIRLFPCCK